MSKEGFDGTQDDIVLTLPDKIKVKDLKWVSVWCRELAQDFGSLNLSGTILFIILNINLKISLPDLPHKMVIRGCQIDNTGPRPFPKQPHFKKIRHANWFFKIAIWVESEPHIIIYVPHCYFTRSNLKKMGPL